jgi:hypothetical protein
LSLPTPRRLSRKLERAAKQVSILVGQHQRGKLCPPPALLIGDVGREVVSQYSEQRQP